MGFIYAKELKTKFSVYGHFYDLKIKNETFKCRSVLEIVSKSVGDIASSKPCTLVVMMNPGSSKPLSADYVPKTYSIDQIMSNSWEKEIVSTRPDNAQYQIMRLMLLTEWKHVRVINLSDLRNGNSGKFSTEFQKAKTLDNSNPHSLTHKDRRCELKQYCSESKTVIVAWGSTAVLRESAKTFLKQVPNVKGLPLESPWFRYPSPYNKQQKLDWLESMNAELNT
ncbi:DUF1643 domain-containing protein [Vibrio parahaemolyticus]|nr:DUF1643 domain-containing protein [Vibrio parahaemolyticus]EIV8670641.1 DUF1643 domain-containing protein [Vibrio parahaemolyticus]